MMLKKGKNINSCGVCVSQKLLQDKKRNRLDKSMLLAMITLLYYQVLKYAMFHEKTWRSSNIFLLMVVSQTFLKHLIQSV